MSFREYTNKTADETLKELRSSALGLSLKDVFVRQKRYGPNTIGKKENFIRTLILNQIKSPFFYLIFLLAGISFLIGEKIDGGVIFIFLIINTSLGFFHELKAEKTIRKLEEYVPIKVRVVRGGKLVVVDRQDLVPGDIVRLKAGDIVPADLRIIEERGLLADESILNGETEKISKNRESLAVKSTDVLKVENTLFSNSIIFAGSGTAIVVATGNKTYLGEIFNRTLARKESSPYEKEILSFSKKIFNFALITIGIFFCLKLISSGTKELLPFLVFYIALAISILPEVLPLITTFALSRGAIKMAEKHVVVKRLSSIEDLGNIEVLCTDKTGTLTENKLVLENIFSKNEKKCLRLATIASSFIKDGSFETSFDEAFFEESSLKQRKGFNKIRHLDSIPFDYSRMRGDVLVKDVNGEKFMVMRGAPEVVLKFCLPNKGRWYEEVLSTFKKEGQKGNRVLAIAFKKVVSKKQSFSEKDEKKLTFLGLLSFADPLKKTAGETIALAKKLGVEIKILTGDSREAASKIAREIKLIDSSEKVISREELEGLSERKFKQVCRDFTVFARISPELKIKIIKSLQTGSRVGFLGEGINDAPALGAANVGLVVAKAAGISRSAADIVLLKKDLRVIIEGIKEGRKIFANLNKYTKSALSANFGNFYAIAGVSLLIGYAPIFPVQILLINLLSDFSLIALATDRVDQRELARPSVFDFRRSLSLVIALTLLNLLVGLAVFFVFRGSEVSVIQTAWFVMGVITQIVLVFTIRSKKVFFRSEKPSLNLALSSLLVIIFTLVFPFSEVGQKVFHLSPLSFGAVAIIIFLVIIYFVLSESVKFLNYRFGRT